MMLKDELAAARAAIDAVDRRIAVLLARRFRLTGPLRLLKKKPTDHARERAVLFHAAAAAGGRYGPAARAVFREIIRQSKRLQARR